MPTSLVLVALALMANVVILTPVLFGLLTQKSWALDAYGTQTAASNILASVYSAIWILSAVCLVLLTMSPQLALAWALPLIAVQIIYKLITVGLVGLGNPVVVSNLIIAIVYSGILYAALTRPLVTAGG